MIQIQYPYNVKNTKISKEDFNNEYYDFVKSFVDEDKLNIQLKIVCENLTFKTLVTSDFEELITLKTKIENSANKDLISSLFKNKKEFIYSKAQPSISEFLMKYNNEMNLKSCHYCNIDFINTFNEIDEYKANLDFLNNANENELEIILKENKSKLIFDNRPFLKIDDIKKISGIGFKTFILIDQLNLESFKNHFTLDHFIGKSDFPYLSLSLYNLIPSCSPCNTKFKHSKEFKIKSSKDSNFSPTSQNFSVGTDIDFKMFFDVNEENSTLNFNKIKSKNDFKVKMQNNTSKEEIDEFIKIFKLQGRYNFHKDVSFKLLKKRKAYSDSQIKEIAGITKRDILDVKKDIFGSVIFNEDENNEPFAKYKKDVAKQLGLIY